MLVRLQIQGDDDRVLSPPFLDFSCGLRPGGATAGTALSRQQKKGEKTLVLRLVRSMLIK